ncbi:MAG: hypothetical protein OEW87_15620 [Flavobacteriaceae bacterium]|nr:hypothetical protein [Flavobacteriaceae bacterium]
MRKIILLISLFLGLVACQNNQEKISCGQNLSDSELALFVKVKLNFYFSSGDLYTSIKFKNCSDEVYYFYRSDLGLDEDNSFMLFVIRKVQLSGAFKEQDEYVKFEGPLKETPYMIGLRTGTEKRIELKPNQEIYSEYNLSKSHKIVSGTYEMFLTRSDPDFKDKEAYFKVNLEDLKLWSLASRSYIIDVDMEKEKILYAKELILKE